MSDGVRYDSGTGRALLAAAVLGSGMAMLDGTVVNVALHRIGTDLDASLEQLQWITNGYLLALASLILLGGSLGDRYGRRRIFVVGVVWFTASSLLCAIAVNSEPADRGAGPARRRSSAAHARKPGDDRGLVPAR